MARNKVTIKDIADSANVSKSTVSRVLNDNTPVNEQKRKAVLAAMERLQYKPNLVARSLAGGSSLTLGVVTQNIGSPFYDSVTQGVIHGMSGSDYSPIFVDGQWDRETEISVVQTLIDRNIDALIMVGGTLDVHEIEELRQDKPTVVIARHIDNVAIPSIAIDNVQAAKKAVEYLIKSGHRRIAHVKGIPEHQDAVDRFKGYCEALSDAGIELEEELIVNGDFSSQSGVLAIESLLMRGATFTAIFASNDEMALGIRLGLYRRGIRVPEDVSIVGFDDQPGSAYMTPPLTTVAQPASDMGEAAAEIALNMLSKKEYELPKLDAELIVRESVKQIRP
ncbi:MAG: LacI family DNA-binding transcriptional regulator [Planctomycetota bacterium]